MSIIVAPEHNAVLIPAPRTTNINRSLFTKTKDVEVQGSKFVIFPYDIYSVALLAGYGFSFEGPIRPNYDWPGRFTPFDHQLKTADFLAQRRRAFCFNEIGTGKTLSSLWAADYLMKQGAINRVLIVSTLSTLVRIWEAELFQTFVGKSVAVLHGSKARRLKLLAQPHDYYIINHEGLKVLSEFGETAQGFTYIRSTAFDDRPDIDHVILDEGARYRNWSTDMYLAGAAVFGPRSKIDRGLWLMTGAPMPKAPTDIWAQARLVSPQLVPQRFTRFREDIMVKVSEFKWVPKKGWEDRVYSMVQPVVRFKRDLIDLPPVVVEPREVKMPPLQAKAYNEMTAKFVTELAEGRITAANEGVKLNKLIQIACGAVYDGMGTTHLLPVQPKIAEMHALIEEAGCKAIVYTPYKHSIAMLEAELVKSYTVGVVNGDVSIKKRNELFYQFQHGELQVLLAHPKAMAHGLDFTASHLIVWWAPYDDFDIYEQANGRITRAGQKHTQVIAQLISCEAEKQVYARMDSKEKMQGLLLNLLTS